MSDKRRWLCRWQRIELVEKCVKEEMTRRQAAAWRRVSVSTVQYWVDRYWRAADHERRTGSWPRIVPLRRIISRGSVRPCSTTVSAKSAAAPAGARA